jgi:hypothetical protein
MKKSLILQAIKNKSPHFLNILINTVGLTLLAALPLTKADMMASQPAGTPHLQGALHQPAESPSRQQTIENAWTPLIAPLVNLTKIPADQLVKAVADLLWPHLEINIVNQALKNFVPNDFSQCLKKITPFVGKAWSPQARQDFLATQIPMTSSQWMEVLHEILQKTCFLRQPGQERKDMPAGPPLSPEEIAAAKISKLYPESPAPMPSENLEERKSPRLVSTQSTVSYPKIILVPGASVPLLACNLLIAEAWQEAMVRAGKPSPLIIIAAGQRDVSDVDTITPFALDRLRNQAFSLGKSQHPMVQYLMAVANQGFNPAQKDKIESDPMNYAWRLARQMAENKGWNKENLTQKVENNRTFLCLNGQKLGFAQEFGERQVVDDLLKHSGLKNVVVVEGKARPGKARADTWDTYVAVEQWLADHKEYSDFLNHPGRAIGIAAMRPFEVRQALQLFIERQKWAQVHSTKDALAKTQSQEVPCVELASLAGLTVHPLDDEASKKGILAKLLRQEFAALISELRKNFFNKQELLGEVSKIGKGAK